MRASAKRAIWLLLVGLLAGGAVALNAKPQAAKRLFLWKATSKDDTVAYLLGSIHVGDKDFYPLPDEVEQAFAESKDLVVEVDITKLGQGAAQAAILEKGSYPDGSSLGDRVPKPVMQRLRAYFSGKSVPVEAVEHLRPWVVSILVTQMEVESLGFASSLGVDKHFMDAAKGRKIIELESADEQVGVLGGLPEEQQVAFLASTLDTAGQAKTLMAKTVAMWKSGDAGGMETLLIKDPVRARPELKPVFAKLIDERNERMAAKIAALEGEGPHFVVVGAAHLIGDKGIVSLLEKKGYRVEQISRGAGVAKAAARAKQPSETKPTKPGERGEPAERKAPANKGYAPAGSWDK
jgi:uncharacterized protein YbaP (TraB family)